MPSIRRSEFEQSICGTEIFKQLLASLFINYSTILETNLAVLKDISVESISFLVASVQAQSTRKIEYFEVFSSFDGTGSASVSFGKGFIRFFK